jgi:hypothetical protein
MTTAPTTIGNIDRTLAATVELQRLALHGFTRGRVRLSEVRNVSERLDALLDHRLAQMALTP